MLVRLKQFAKKLVSRLSAAAHELFRHLTQRARPNLVTVTLADLPRGRAELLTENALLRQQLIVLHRHTTTPRLTWRERLSLLSLARWVPHWKQVLQVIKPDAAALASSGLSLILEIQVTQTGADAAASLSV